MRRRWWGAAVAAAVAALLLAFAGLRPRGGLRTIWTAPWGSAGVATRAGPDGTVYGPLAFAAGRAFVVIADSFGRRLLLVPRAGGPARTVELGPDAPLVEALTTAGDGPVYYAGDATVWRWGGAGRPEPVARVADAGASLSLIEGLAALPGDGGVAVDLLTLDRRRATRSVFVLQPGGGRRRIAHWSIDESAAAAEATLPEAIVPAGGRAMAVGPDGDVYLLGFTRAGRRAVFRVDPGGGTVAVLRPPAAHGRWSLIGVDRSGRVYLGIDLGSPAGRVLALGRRGRVVLSRALPLSAAVRLGAYAAIAADGDLYVLDARAGGLRLRRWRLRRGLASTGGRVATAGQAAGLHDGVVYSRREGLHCVLWSSAAACS